MIWVIAGTLDGRTLAVDIQERTGEDVLVTVVSQYGAAQCAPINRCKPSVRRSCDRNGTRGSQGSRYSIRSF